MVRKEENEDSDVPMGSFDRARVCQLVGNYILHQLSQFFEQHSTGLYRDDSLVILKGLSSTENERVKKKSFKDCGIKITIKTNLHLVNFLDITLDLHSHTYESSWKPGNHPVYFNKSSNHAKRILRELSKLVSKRLSDLSPTK